MSVISDQQHLDALARAKKEARKDGAFAGLSAALAGGIIGSKLFRFSRYTTLFCGALTGVLAGHQFTQGFMSSNLAKLEAEAAHMRKSALQQQSEGLSISGTTTESPIVQ